MFGAKTFAKMLQNISTKILQNIFEDRRWLRVK